MKKIDTTKLLQSVVTWGAIGILAYFITLSMSNNNEMKTVINKQDNQDQQNVDILHKLDVIYETNTNYQKVQVTEHNNIVDILGDINKDMGGLKENQRIIFQKIPTITEIERQMMENNLRTYLRPDSEYEFITDTLMTLEEMFN